MIELQVSEPDPIETALIEWFRAADLYRDGVLVHKGVNLLGSNEGVAKVWAKKIANSLAAGALDIESLTAFLLSRDSAQHVRAYSSAPIIAEGILLMLHGKGLL
jgi:hypothetical protein